MPLINFPDVPIAAGVPNVRRAVAGIGARLGIDQALLKYGLIDVLSYKWGIVDNNGQTVISPNVFMSIDYHGDVKSASHPVEPVDKVRGGMGSFANYNKVANPNDIIVRMVFSQSDSGSDSIVGVLTGQSIPSRSDALKILESMRDSTKVFNIATPDAAYSSYSLESIGHRRDGKNGVSMLTVECRFMEIRQTAEVRYTNTDKSSASDTKSNGTANPEEPAAKELSVLEKASKAVTGKIAELQNTVSSIQNKISANMAKYTGVVGGKLGVQ